MKPEDLLVYSQQPATCAYCESNKFSPHSFFLLRIHFNVYCHLHVGLYSVFFPSGFPTKIYRYLTFLPHVLHAPSISFFLIFITLTVFDEEYKSRSSLVCSLLHFLVTSSLLGPNNFPPAFCFQTPPAYASPSNWETNFILTQNCRQYTLLCVLIVIFLDSKNKSKMYRTKW
jgi:hypothetical protein